MESRISNNADRGGNINKAESGRDMAEIFDRLSNGGGTVDHKQLLDALADSGISEKDPRITDLFSSFVMGAENQDRKLNQRAFTQLLQKEQAKVLLKALRNELVIPYFKSFKKDIREIFEQTKDNEDGEMDELLPHPDPGRQPAYAVSVCTVDGQLLQLGDHDLGFVIQSICKPVNYAIACEEVGQEKVHQHVGVEPGSESFESSMMLNEEDLPHNPMITSGAIMTSSLIQPDREVDERLKHVMDVWGQITGDKEVAYKKESFEIERKNADKHFALTYLMKQREAFAEDVDPESLLEFYLKCCGIEVNIDDLAHAAATFANYGQCPTTQKKVFQHDTVRNTLSLMLSSGMYDHSGDFAFRVGLPAKSGIGGGIMLVVPNVMGIAIYSPPLDEHGNSVRGVKFCERLVDTFSLHKYDSIHPGEHGKKDPRRLDA